MDKAYILLEKSDTCKDAQVFTSYDEAYAAMQCSWAWTCQRDGLSVGMNDCGDPHIYMDIDGIPEDSTDDCWCFIQADMAMMDYPECKKRHEWRIFEINKNKQNKGEKT